MFFMRYRFRCKVVKLCTLYTCPNSSVKDKEVVLLLTNLLKVPCRTVLLSIERLPLNGPCPKLNKLSDINKKTEPLTFLIIGYSIKIFNISIAASLIFVPGPKTATAPESNKNS